MSFTPQNKFETSLLSAAQNTASIPQFYKDFAQAEIYLIHEGEATDGQKLNIQQIEFNGKMYIPIFSSIPRIQSAIKSEVKYVGIKAIELVKATQGAELLLNPGSEYGKTFTRTELLSILNGSIWDSTHLN